MAAAIPKSCLKPVLKILRPRSRTRLKLVCSAELGRGQRLGLILPTESTADSKISKMSFNQRFWLPKL